MGAADPSFAKQPKIRRLLFIGGALVLLAIIWHVVIAPRSLYLPSNFSYSAAVVSRDNFYDEKTAAFSGETVSNTKFGYQTLSSKNNVLNVQNFFDVSSAAGDKIFAVERTYGIDRKTHQHVSGYGDKGRQGYLFGPPNAAKKSFVYWHVNYDAPATMYFQNEEDILGLTTYHYAADYHADQTKDLTNLPGVGKTRGINLDIHLELWIEPATGFLVKYEDHSTAYYYDLATQQRLNPWNRFSNTYSFESVAEKVQEADQLKRQKQSNEAGTPIFFALIGAIFLGRWTLLYWRQRSKTAGYASPAVVSALFIGLIGLAALAGWVFHVSLLTQLNQSFAPMHVMTALNFVALAVVLWLLSRPTMSPRARLVLRLLLVLVLGVASLSFLRNALGYWQGIDGVLSPDTVLSPPVSAFCFMVISVVLLATTRPLSKVVAFLAQVCLGLVFCLAIFGIIGYAFSLHQLHTIYWFQSMALHSGAAFVVLVATIFALNPTWSFTALIRRFGNSFLLSITVLSLMLVLTGMLWQQTIGSTEKQANIRFQSDAHRLNDTIDGKLSASLRALEGARGLFAASQQVDRDEWKAYVDNLGLSQNYPGVLGFGFAQMVPAAEKEAHIARIRSEGYPSYTIFPADDTRDMYSSVVYIEPFNESNQHAFGYDMTTDPTRRAAMELARDSGEPTASGKVVLIQDSGTKGQYGILVYVPLYHHQMPLSSVAERRAALLGFVYMPIRVGDFVRATIGEQAAGLNVEAFDAPAISATSLSNRLSSLDSAHGIETQSSSPSEFTRGETLSLAGHIFVMRYSSLPSYGGDITLQSLPGAVLFVGILLSFLIAVITFLQSSSRARALKLAQSMTVDLRNERNLAVTTQHKDEAILTSIGDGVFVIDMAGKILLFNKAAEEISGYTAQEVIGRSYKEVLAFQSEEDDHLVEEFITTALSGTRAEMALHTRLKRKDGATVPVADSAAPIIDAQGSRDGAVVVFRDTTRERQLERMKDEFLSIASHELRTPMGAVRANLSMILDGDYGPVNKDLVEPLTDIKTSTIRLVNLVNDLLNVARIEAGRTKFTLSEFDINEVIRATVESLAPLGKEKGIAITHKSADPITVQADADKVAQVLTNLIGNALKFTEKGSIEVVVVNNANMAEVAVVDTGMGIALDDQSKLFGKFKQITTAQDGKPQGTGLGLYISRELIRKMGGELWIKQSDIGKGSTFVFTLPCVDTASATRAKQVLEREAEAHPDQK